MPVYSRTNNQIVQEGNLSDAKGANRGNQKSKLVKVNKQNN